MSCVGMKRKKVVCSRRPIAFLILMVLFVLCIFALAKYSFEPNIQSISKQKATGLVQKVINQALAQEMKKDKFSEPLFTTREDKDGNIKMIQADSTRINILLTGLSINIQNRFQEMKRYKMSVPLGSLLGSQILSQTGPQVAFCIIPLSISSMDFNTEFTSQGINQTKYKIYINITCDIKILAPLSNRDIKASSQVLIAEAVIVGEVPDSYVKVPKEDILDVTEE